MQIHDDGEMCFNAYASLCVVRLSKKGEWVGVQTLSFLRNAEMPQSQIPGTIVRGSGRFNRTVKRKSSCTDAVG